MNKKMIVADETTVRHAAHYLGGNNGHDLTQWTYAQDQRLPVPANVPRDAEYHVGFIKDGVQHWVYHRRAKFSPGKCDRCK